MDAVATPSADAAAIKGAKADLESSATTVVPPGAVRKETTAQVGSSMAKKVVIGIGVVVILAVIAGLAYKFTVSRPEP
jgi:hypothetical protein